jgi:hypothetical protein
MPTSFLPKNPGYLSKEFTFTGIFITTSINPIVMKEQLIQKLEVQSAVKEVMEKHISRWQSVPALKTQYDRFILNLNKIDGYQTILQHDLAPLKEKRNLARSHMVETLFTISGALGVYASDVRDRKLINLLKGKFREIEKLKTEELVKYGDRVLQQLKSLLENDQKQGKKESRHPIRDYGITEKLQIKLQSALDNYRDAINAHFEASLNKKKSQVKLVKKIRENETLLKQKMDRMIHLFKDDQKVFYNDYIKSRMQPAQAKTAATATEEASEVAGKKATTATTAATAQKKRTPPSQAASKKTAARQPAATRKPAGTGRTPTKPAGGEAGKPGPK